MLKDGYRHALALRGSDVTFGGVSIFWASLFQGAFCSGFLGHIPHVSWLGGVYPGWERGTFPPAGRRELLIMREKVSTRVCTRRLMLDNATDHGPHWARYPLLGGWREHIPGGGKVGIYQDVSHVPQTMANSETGRAPRGARSAASGPSFD